MLLKCSAGEPSRRCATSVIQMSPSCRLNDPSSGFDRRVAIGTILSITTLLSVVITLGMHLAAHVLLSSAKRLPREKCLLAFFGRSKVQSMR